MRFASQSRNLYVLFLLSMFLSTASAQSAGRVVMGNGDPVPTNTPILIDCAASELRVVGQTRQDGTFSATNWSGTINPFRGDCDLLAQRSGYRSTRIRLLPGNATFRDLGVIILRPMGDDGSEPVTATTGLAPEEAQAEYGQGLASISNDDWDTAEEHLKKAVARYDRFAEAWYQLGRVYEHDKDLSAADAAYHSALDADSQYLVPLLRLSAMALDRGDFNALLDYSNTLIRRNPFEYPTAYYFNGVAHLQLHQLPEAEEAARQAIQMDPDNANPRSHYLMGFVLANSGKLEEARTEFETYLELSPDANDADVARNTLAQIAKDLAARQ